MSEMFAEGAAVVYDIYGVCRIKEIKPMSFTGGKPTQKYYVLSPLNSSLSTYYVPVDSEKLTKKLRNPLTKSEIHSLLHGTAKNSMQWIENRQMRSETFRAILNEGVSAELLSLIKCLFERKQELSEKGKSLSATDENMLSSAEKLICEEFAFSLGTEKENVTGYICDYIEKHASE